MMKNFGSAKLFIVQLTPEGLRSTHSLKSNDWSILLPSWRVILIKVQLYSLRLEMLQNDF